MNFKILGSKSIIEWGAKHAPQFLMGLGVMSGAGSLVTTVGATKASIDEMKKSGIENPTKMEWFQKCWKNFIIPAGMAGISTLAYFGAYKMKSNEALGLAALLGVSQTRLSTLQEEIEKQLGERKFAEVHQAEVQRQLAGDRFKSVQTPESENGLYLVWDPISNQKFRSNYDRIMRGVAETDRELASPYSDYVTFNDFIRNVDEPGFDTWAWGEKMAWHHNESDRGTQIRITHGVTDNMEPCLVLDYDKNPPQWYG